MSARRNKGDVIAVVTPPAASAADALESGLVNLTRLIARVSPDVVAHGLLGGEFGYGAHFENDVFMMHPFCWCEREDCPWCAGCSCPPEAFHYFVDGAEVSYEAWVGFYDQMTKHLRLGSKAHSQASEEANRRRECKYDALCRYCRGEFGNAPNFHFKPTGFRVRWYKWIGRGMEIDDKTLPSGGYRALFDACMASMTQGFTVR